MDYYHYCLTLNPLHTCMG